MSKESSIKYDVGILVVLYGCEYKDSETLSCLSTITNYRNCKLVIWNNGPDSISYDINLNDFWNVEVKNTIENIPLSYIYNTFLNEYQCEKYVFFDHDSKVTSDYLEHLQKTNFDIYLPRIFVDNKCFFPICKLSLQTIEKEMKVDSHVVSSIMTGLCLNSDVKKLFFEVFSSVFDERFALYGIDTTFFNRLRKLPKLEVSIFGKIKHSLSSQDPIESNSDFRLTERAFDIAIQLRHYPSKVMFKNYFIGVFKAIRSRKIKLVSAYVVGFIQGTHPRTKKMGNKSL